MLVPIPPTLWKRSVTYFCNTSLHMRGKLAVPTHLSEPSRSSGLLRRWIHGMMNLVERNTCYIVPMNI